MHTPYTVRPSPLLIIESFWKCTRYNNFCAFNASNFIMLKHLKYYYQHILIIQYCMVQQQAISSVIERRFLFKLILIYIAIDSFYIYSALISKQLLFADKRCKLTSRTKKCISFVTCIFCLFVIPCFNRPLHKSEFSVRNVSFIRLKLFDKLLRFPIFYFKDHMRRLFEFYDAITFTL